MITDSPGASTHIDSSIPHAARVWDYVLGGKNNYAVDREAGEEILARIPDIREGARAERAFLRRVVTMMARAGVRQFLDVGTGLPTMDNTHQVAQGIDPGSRVVYVDNDPLVMAHARAHLVGIPPGTVDYVHADLRDPHEILAAAARTLDLRRPVGLLLLGVANHVVDDEQVLTAVRRLVDATAAGSFLALTHSTAELHGDLMHEVMADMTARGAPVRARTPAEIEAFFTGTTVLDPGIVSCSRWHPDQPGPRPEPVYLFGGVARID